MKKELIQITETMSRKEKKEARKKNLEIAYEEIDQYFKDHPVTEETPEEKKRVTEYLRKQLQEKGISLDE